MPAPSLKTQASAVRTAAQHTVSLGKAAGLRAAQIELLREQLAAAAVTLDEMAARIRQP